MFGLKIRTKVLTDLIPKGESGKTEELAGIRDMCWSLR
jgi:hypothetical protein